MSNIQENSSFPRRNSIKDGLIVALAVAPTVLVVTIIVLVLLHRHKRHRRRKYGMLSEPPDLARSPTSPTINSAELRRLGMIRKSLAGRSPPRRQRYQQKQQQQGHSKKGGGSVDGGDTDRAIGSPGIVSDWKVFEENLYRQRLALMKNHPVMVRGQPASRAPTPPAVVIQRTQPTCRSPPPVYQRHGVAPTVSILKIPPPLFQ